MPINTNITTVSRSTLSEMKGTISSGTKVFPANLDATRAVGIYVYDTDPSDLMNVGWDAALKKVEDLKEKAFKDINTSINTNAKFFDALKNTKASIGNSDLPSDLKATFFLPLPNNLQESNSHSWNEENGWFDSFAGGAVAGAAIGAAAGKAAGAGTVGQVATGLAGAASGNALKAGIKALEPITANIAKMTGSQNYKYYENKIQMYNNSAFRSITLAWTLIPNNQKESNTIHELIREIKMYASPQTLAGKMLLRSPHFFKLDFFNKTIRDALQFSEVVINNIDVTYSPGGNMDLFHDAMPKSVELQIQFTERQPKTAEDWGAGWKDESNQKTGGNC